MGFGDLGCDVEPQSEALPAGVRVASKKGLEELVHRRGRDGLSRVGDPEHE